MFADTAYYAVLLIMTALSPPRVLVRLRVSITLKTAGKKEEKKGLTAEDARSCAHVPTFQFNHSMGKNCQKSPVGKKSNSQSEGKISH